MQEPGARVVPPRVPDCQGRSCLGLDLLTSIPAARVIRFVEQLIEIHGKPAAIRCDNGPELTSYDFTEWCKAKDIELRFIQPGKPDQKAFIERFNPNHREEVSLVGGTGFEPVTPAV